MNNDESAIEIQIKCEKIQSNNMSIESETNHQNQIEVEKSEQSEIKSTTIKEEDIIEKIDLCNSNNIYCVSQYVNEIYQYLRHREEALLISSKFIENEPKISVYNRMIIAEWIVTVHYELQFQEETLFQAFNILDQYITKEQEEINVEQFQLTALSSIFIAFKVEDIKVQDYLASQFANILCNQKTLENLLDKESRILSVIDFNTTLPTSLQFFQRFSSLLKINETTYYLSYYLIEIALFDYKYKIYKQSLVAAASIYTAYKIQGLSKQWSEFHVLVTGYKKEDVSNLGIYICQSWDFIQNNIQLVILRNKFSTPKYAEISKFKAKLQNNQPTQQENQKQ